jgi:sugar phosphate isomerase/epimerase
LQTRRRFLRNAAAMAPAVALAGRGAWALAPVPLGVQLFTVRKEAERNLPHVLEQIRKIGYQEVETYASLYTFSADALRHMIVDADLRVPSGHFNYDDLGTRFPYATELGLEWMVCSMIPPTMWNSFADFHTAAQQFNAWGKQAKDLGMRFAFHNHDYEFRPLSAQGLFAAGTGVTEKTGYDVLMQETDPELVFFEVDVYWAAQAGHDPVTLMRLLGSRLKMLHLKDRAPGFPVSYDMNPESGHFEPVGKGTLDWKAILAEGERLGVEHYFVEQDQSKGPAIDAVRASYEYLRKMGIRG